MASLRSLSNLIVFRNSQGVQARGSLLKLSRTTLVFEVYNPYSIVQLSEILHDVEIRSGERLIYNGRAVVSNLVNTGLMLIVSARLIDDWAELTGLLDDPARIQEEVERFIGTWEETSRIRPTYQLTVSRIRAFLTELNRWLEHVDIEGDVGDGANGAAADDEGFFNTLAEALLPPLGEMFARFEEAAAEVTEEERTSHARYVQQDLHPLLLRAPFVHRAYYKPLGYAGDHEMVSMMLREPREGPTTYARLINTLHLKTGPAEAHRNRIAILEEWLTDMIVGATERDTSLHGLNVGCGPAIELQRLMRDCPQSARCRMELMDFNEETLELTRKKLQDIRAETDSGPEYTFIHESVHHLLKESSKAGTDGDRTYDFVYCAGLFDYLSDKVCSRLLGLFYQWVRPGGRVMVTNVHPDNDALYLMEHILEWYLIYRDEDKFRSLVPAEWIRRVFIDATGINVFMELEKPLSS